MFSYNTLFSMKETSDYCVSETGNEYKILKFTKIFSICQIINLATYDPYIYSVSRFSFGVVTRDYHFREILNL